MEDNSLDKLKKKLSKWLQRLAFRLGGRQHMFAEAGFFVGSEPQNRMRAAQELLANPCFRYVVEKIESDFHNLWMTTEVDECELRESYYYRTLMLRTIVHEINGVLHTAFQQAEEKVASMEDDDFVSSGTAEGE